MAACLRLFGGKISCNVLIQRVASSGIVAFKNTVVHESQTGVVPNVKPFKDIPGPKGMYMWPIIGPMLHFKPFTKYTAEHADRVINELFEKYGTIFKMRLGKSHVMICDPKDIETVYRNEGKYPQRPSLTIVKAYHDRTNIKPSLALVDGEEWQTLRSPLNKRVLKFDSAHNYLQSQNIVADKFVSILATQELSAEDLADLLFCYTAESIGLVCFNARLGFLDVDKKKDPETGEFLNASKELFVNFYKCISGQSLTHAYYRNKVYRGYESAMLKLRELTLKHLKNAKHVLETQKKDGTFDPNKPNLLLSLLSDNTLEFDDVVGNVNALYVGGIDTTAKNLQTLFYNLAFNPDKQEKLREEVHRVMGREQPMTPEAIANLQYLKACLKESFRLFNPIISGTLRILPVDVVLGGYKVPAGTVILIHTNMSCKMFFKNSDKFIPERWLRSSDGLTQEVVHPMASLPFGHGPRNCIGRRFAEQEMYLATAKTWAVEEIRTVRPGRQECWTHVSIRVRFSYLG